MRHQPGIQVACPPGIDSFENVRRGVMLVKLHRELRVDGGQTVRYDATRVFGKYHANAGYRSTQLDWRARCNQSRAKVRLLLILSEDSPAGTASTATYAEPRRSSPRA